MKNLILRNARLVLDSGIGAGEVAVRDGRIAAIGSSLSANGAVDVDLHGAFVFPGFLDAHVHFNEPGREHWEGLATGSRSLAAGGGTIFIDMPLNSHPPVLDAEALQTKRRVAEKKSILDFALWGGLCPGHTDEIDAMAEAGAAGFKAFLCASGIAEFPTADAGTLKEGMRRARRWHLPVAVHAEDPQVLDHHQPTGRCMRDFLTSRPKQAEVSAIRLACEIAGETGASLHVVHVSCQEGLAEIAQAKRAGVDVTAETCPHYLLFDANDAVRLGARAKCAPPLREPDDVEALWAALMDGQVDTIGSDHSPAPPEKKTGNDAFAIWGGISGCQHAFPCFLSALHRRTPDRLVQAAAWLSSHPATRFRMKTKGQLKSGFDADLTVIDFREPTVIRRKDLVYRHQLSLYEDHTTETRVVHVLRRGEFLIRNGTLTTSPNPGRFLRPTS